VRFAKENVRLVAEIMAKHFSDETIINCSGILFEEEMQPEFVLEEFESEQPDAPPLPPPGPMPAPNMGGPVPGPGNPPLPAPAPNMGVPAPIQPPMTGDNIIPFNPAGGGVPFPPLMPPVQPDPALLIAKKLEKAFQLIRDEITFGYRIDIETDSTIFGDAMQERQDATEFITAVTAFMEKAAMASQMIPESVGLFGRML